MLKSPARGILLSNGTHFGNPLDFARFLVVRQAVVSEVEADQSREGSPRNHRQGIHRAFEAVGRQVEFDKRRQDTQGAPRSAAACCGVLMSLVVFRTRRLARGRGDQQAIQPEDVE